MAGTHVVTSRSAAELSKGVNSKKVEIVTTTFVADSADGTVPVLQIPLHGFILKVVTNPGSTAPTDNWDFILGDPEDAALDAGVSNFLNRHTTTTQQIYPAASATSWIPLFVAGTYALTVTGNSVNSASGRIIFYIVDSL